jgi:ATP-dependent DNA ligase
VTALKARSCLIDGEAVCCDDNGMAVFAKLRRRRNDRQVAVRVRSARACQLGLEGVVSKRLGSRYTSGRSRDWLKFKNPAAPAVRREAEEDWG